METVTTKNKPLFTHDCDVCVYLGSDELMDFYFCEKSYMGESVSLIIRLSDKPSDYLSMPANIAEQGILSGEIRESAFDKCYQLYKAYISKK